MIYDKEINHHTGGAVPYLVRGHGEAVGQHTRHHGAEGRNGLHLHGADVAVLPQ